MCSTMAFTVGQAGRSDSSDMCAMVHTSAKRMYLAGRCALLCLHDNGGGNSQVPLGRLFGALSQSWLQMKNSDNGAVLVLDGNPQTL